MQLLGEDLAFRLLSLYNSGTTSSTSRLLGKCAVYAAEMAFWFPIYVAINLPYFLMINGAPFSFSPRDKRLCCQMAPLFVRQTDKMAGRLVTS